MATESTVCGISKNNLKRVTTIHEIFNYVGRCERSGFAHQRIVDSSELSPPQLERIQEVHQILQKWVYEISLKHGFGNSGLISMCRWQSYIRFIHDDFNPNHLLYDDIFLFLLWQGEDKYLTENLSSTRKSALYYKMLNIHCKTEEEMNQLMSTITFNDYIHQALDKDRVETMSPETTLVKNVICDKAANCDTCNRNGVGLGNYLFAELDNLI